MRRERKQKKWMNRQQTWKCERERERETGNQKPSASDGFWDYLFVYFTTTHRFSGISKIYKNKKDLSYIKFSINLQILMGRF